LCCLIDPPGSLKISNFVWQGLRSASDVPSVMRFYKNQGNGEGGLSKHTPISLSPEMIAAEFSVFFVL
jgi:hypothetical protein